MWAFLHSGSRGIGNKIAQHHIKVAQALCERWWIPLPHPDLAYLVQDTPEFWDDIRQMQWAQRFAQLNREEMMDRVLVCVTQCMKEPVNPTDVINCHHNFTQQEHHWRKEVWVTRKGAIREHGHRVLRGHRTG